MSLLNRALQVIANFYGFEVAFGINPDLKINKKGMEVKNANSLDFRTCLRKAIDQPHDIVAIEVSSLDDNWRSKVTKVTGVKKE